MSSLQTPTRGRVHSQEDAYFTPTSAHISRFQLRPKGHGGSIPFVLPSVKPGMTSGGSFRSPSRVDKENTTSHNNNDTPNILQREKSTTTLASPQADRTRTRPQPKSNPRPNRPAHLPGFNIYPDLPLPLSPHGLRPSDGSPLRQSFKSVTRSPGQKPRMGRRSLTFPMSGRGEVEEGGGNENENEDTGRGGQGATRVQVGSSVRRRVNSDRPGSVQTVSLFGCSSKVGLGIIS